MKLEDILVIATSCSGEIGDGLQALEVISSKLALISQATSEAIPHLRVLKDVGQSISKKMSQPKK